MKFGILSKRLICLVLVVLFNFNCIFPQPAMAQALQIPKETGKLEILKIVEGLPSTAGSVKEYFAASEKTSQPFIVSIEDAHSNPEAQRNIGEILKFLAAKPGFRKIGLEGAAGAIHPEYLKLFSENPKANDVTANFLLEQGELSGAELFAYGTPKGVNFQGMEDRELYRANLKNYQELLRKSDSVKAVFAKLDAALDSVIAPMKNKTLRNFLRESERRAKSGSTSIKDYEALSRLAGEELSIDLSSRSEQWTYPNLTRILFLLELEGLWNLEKISADWEIVTAELAKTLGDENPLVERLAGMAPGQKTLVRKESKMSYESTSRYLFEQIYKTTAGKMDFSAHPDFLKYTAFLILNEEVESEGLFAEIDSIERAIEAKLAKTPEEKELIALVQTVSSLERLLNLSVTRKDYRKVQELGVAANAVSIAAKVRELGGKMNVTGTKKDFLDEAWVKEFSEYQSAAESFYTGARAREEAIFKNLLAWLSANKAGKGVMVMGGFHTEGFAELMRAGGVSHIILTPVVKNAEAGEKLYKDVMLDKNLRAGLSVAPAANVAAGFIPQELLMGDSGRIVPVLTGLKDQLMEALRGLVTRMRLDQAIADLGRKIAAPMPTPALAPAAASLGLEQVADTIDLDALSPEQTAILELLLNMGQAHIFTGWAARGIDEDKKREFLDSLVSFNGQYPGGLAAYPANVRRILAATTNRLVGYIASDPKLITTNLTGAANRTLYEEMRALGERAAHEAGYIQVAGGRGDRLGFKGIKLAIEYDPVLGISYLGWDVRSALEDIARVDSVPAQEKQLFYRLMTSTDNDELTQKLIGASGLDLREGAIRTGIQMMVPGIDNVSGRLAVDKNDPYRLEWISSGHGDVHRLIHAHGWESQALDAGIQYLFFIQDTNGQVVNVTMPTLGVAIDKKLDIAVVAIPRQLGAKVGLLVGLEPTPGSGKLPIPALNVEYNEVKDLGGEAEDPATPGNSLYQGNINAFLVRLEPGFVSWLSKRNGALAHSIFNAKNTDPVTGDITPAGRIETMMQSLYEEMAQFSAEEGIPFRIGIVKVDPIDGFSTTKNELAKVADNASKTLITEGLVEARKDHWDLTARWLRDAGVKVNGTNVLGFSPDGYLIPISWEMVSFSPEFVRNPADVRAKFSGGGVIAADSTLGVEGRDIRFENLSLNGALIVRAADGVSLRVKDLAVENAGWKVLPMTKEQVEEALISPDPNKRELGILGHDMDKKETLEIVIWKPGTYVLEGTTLYEVDDSTGERRIVREIAQSGNYLIGVSSFDEKDAKNLATLTQIMASRWEDLATWKKGTRWPVDIITRAMDKFIMGFNGYAKADAPKDPTLLPVRDLDPTAFNFNKIREKLQIFALFNLFGRKYFMMPDANPMGNHHSLLIADEVRPNALDEGDIRSVLAIAEQNPELKFFQNTESYTVNHLHVHVRKEVFAFEKMEKGTENELAASDGVVVSTQKEWPLANVIFRGDDIDALARQAGAFIDVLKAEKNIPIWTFMSKGQVVVFVGERGAQPISAVEEVLGKNHAIHAVEAVGNILIEPVKGENAEVQAENAAAAMELYENLTDADVERALKAKSISEAGLNELLLRAGISKGEAASLGLIQAAKNALERHDVVKKARNGDQAAIDRLIAALAGKDPVINERAAEKALSKITDPRARLYSLLCNANVLEIVRDYKNRKSMIDAAIANLPDRSHSVDDVNVLNPHETGILVLAILNLLSELDLTDEIERLVRKVESLVEVRTYDALHELDKWWEIENAQSDFRRSVNIQPALDFLNNPEAVRAFLAEQAAKPAEGASLGAVRFIIDHYARKVFENEGFVYDKNKIPLIEVDRGAVWVHPAVEKMPQAVQRLLLLTNSATRRKINYTSLVGCLLLPGGVVASIAVLASLTNDIVQKHWDFIFNSDAGRFFSSVAVLLTSVAGIILGVLSWLFVDHMLFLFFGDASVYIKNSVLYASAEKMTFRNKIALHDRNVIERHANDEGAKEITSKAMMDPALTVQRRAVVASARLGNQEAIERLITASGGNDPAIDEKVAAMELRVLNDPISQLYSLLYERIEEKHPELLPAMLKVFPDAVRSGKAEQFIQHVVSLIRDTRGSHKVPITVTRRDLISEAVYGIDHSNTYTNEYGEEADSSSGGAPSSTLVEEAVYGEPYEATVFKTESYGELNIQPALDFLNNPEAVRAFLAEQAAKPADGASLGSRDGRLEGKKKLTVDSVMFKTFVAAVISVLFLLGVYLAINGGLMEFFGVHDAREPGLTNAVEIAAIAAIVGIFSLAAFVVLKFIRLAIWSFSSVRNSLMVHAIVKAARNGDRGGIDRLIMASSGNDPVINEKAALKSLGSITSPSDHLYALLNMGNVDDVSEQYGNDRFSILRVLGIINDVSGLSEWRTMWAIYLQKKLAAITKYAPAEQAPSVDAIRQSGSVLDMLTSIDQGRRLGDYLTNLAQVKVPRTTKVPDKVRKVPVVRKELVTRSVPMTWVSDEGGDGYVPVSDAGDGDSGRYVSGIVYSQDVESYEDVEAIEEVVESYRDEVVWETKIDFNKVLEFLSNPSAEVLSQLGISAQPEAQSLGQAEDVDAVNGALQFLADPTENLPMNPDVLIVLGNENHEANGRAAAEAYIKYKPRFVMFAGKGKGEIPEADLFREVFEKSLAEKGVTVPAEAIIIENGSMTTGQNAEFGKRELKKKLIAAKDAEALSKRSLTAILMQKPTHMRLSRMIFEKQFEMPQGIRFYSNTAKIALASADMAPEEMLKAVESALKVLNRYIPYSEEGFLDLSANEAAQMQAMIDQLTAIKERLQPEAASLGLEEISDKVNLETMTDEELDALQMLLDFKQQHLFEIWERKGLSEDRKKAFVRQVIEMNRNYPGGLAAYREHAREHVAAAEARKKATDEGEKNPFPGYTPRVPTIIDLAGAPLAGEYARLQREGVRYANRTVIVEVAGGLGQRLGYEGIKIAIPVELLTGMSYQGWYSRNLLTYENLAQEANEDDQLMRLNMMVSDDTAADTELLRGADAYFGALAERFSSEKQGSVPAVTNKDADFTWAILEKDDAGHVTKVDPYQLEAQPHGHGDVHMLLAQSQEAKRWLADGYEYVAFIQDTNGQVFNGLIPALAVSAENGFDMNFLTVPRKAGEAAGLIMDLVHEDGSVVTGNVEYNQGGPFLEATTGQGDIPVPGTDNLSPYPGNLNVFVVKLSTYVQVLDATRGIVEEFVNPKFRSDGSFPPARLETMMQDLAKALPQYAPGSRVGVTNFDRGTVFSPVKNNLGAGEGMAKKGNFPDTMPKGEADFYEWNRRLLQNFGGVEINVEGTERVTHGNPYHDGAKIVWSPDFAVLVDDVAKKVKGGKISDRSSLVIEGKNVSLENLRLDGALVINVPEGAELTVKDLVVENPGWEFVDLTDEEVKVAPPHLKIRGYDLVKHAQMSIVVPGPGKWEIGADGVLKKIGEIEAVSLGAVDAVKAAQIFAAGFVGVGANIPMEVLREAYDAQAMSLGAVTPEVAAEFADDAEMTAVTEVLEAVAAEDFARLADVFGQEWVAKNRQTILDLNAVKSDREAGDIVTGAIPFVVPQDVLMEANTAEEAVRAAELMKSAVQGNDVVIVTRPAKAAVGKVVGELKKIARIKVAQMEEALLKSRYGKLAQGLEGKGVLLRRGVGGDDAGLADVSVVQLDEKSLKEIKLKNVAALIRKISDENVEVRRKMYQLFGLDVNAEGKIIATVGANFAQFLNTIYTSAMARRAQETAA